MGRQARTYEFLYAEVKPSPDRDKEVRKYRLMTSVAGASQYKEWGKILRVGYGSSCRLSFINQGLDVGDEESDTAEAFDIVYQVEREAIVLAFDLAVCNAEQVRVSLPAALYHAIKTRYGFDEGELGLLVDVMAEDGAPPGDWYAVLYDRSGHHNVMLNRVYAELADIVWAANQRLEICACENGCYQCLKSYYTAYITHSADKAAALMFTGYLSEQSPFRPSLKPMESASMMPDLDMSVRLDQSEVRVTTGTSMYQDAMDDGQNEAIFSLMSKAVVAEHRPGMKSIRISVFVDYLGPALWKGRVKKGRAAFQQLQLQLLRFPKVEIRNKDH